MIIIDITNHDLLEQTLMRGLRGAQGPLPKNHKNRVS